MGHDVCTHVVWLRDRGRVESLELKRDLSNSLYDSCSRSIISIFLASLVSGLWCLLSVVWAWLRSNQSMSNSSASGQVAFLFLDGVRSHCNNQHVFLILINKLFLFMVFQGMLL